MSAGVISKPQVGETSRDEYVLKLQEVFETSFTVWEKNGEGLWEALTVSPEETLSPKTELLDQANQRQEPVSMQIESGCYMMAVPVPGVYHRLAKKVATATFYTDTPQFLRPLAEASLQGIKLQYQVDQLTKENTIFLEQVSEDFEELAFLRSMAERLALDDSHQDFNHLIWHALPLLGEAAGVESIYHVANTEGTGPRIKHAWHHDQSQSAGVEAATIKQLVELFHEDATGTPVVRNHLEAGETSKNLPGVREFILVEISTGVGQYGWLLAINRKRLGENKLHAPICKLSKNELGTNEASLISTAAAMVASHTHNLTLLEERESLLVTVVRTLVSAIDSRDPYTCGHSERVARYGKRLARAVGFDEEACQKLYLTGLLHDIGKIGVSDAVLNKKGALTDEEFDEIKRHPHLGWAILRELEPLEYVLPGVLHHHERYDGKGYPDGLVGKETPLDGRLLAVVDAFDAMTSDRPYRQGMPVEKAVGILADGAGSQWDAKLVESFISILPEILKIKDNYQRPPLPDRVPGKLKNGEGALLVASAPVA
ncbi:MAG: HD-GYP domain-containing protein [Pirellulales bacterium]|nr:HD-GYP domain-containing protein [Pirellulales bacterium]